MRREIALVAVGLVAVFVGGELGVRAIHEHLPDPAPWPTNETRVKDGQMTDLNLSNGGAPIVFLGTSVTEAAVDADRLSRESGGRLLYNAATPFATQDAYEIWMDGFVMPTLHPDVTVVGLPMWSLGFAQRLEQPGSLATGLKHVIDSRRPEGAVQRILDQSYLIRYRGELKTVLDLLDMSYHPEAAGLWSDFGVQTGYYDRYRPDRVRSVISGDVDRVDLAPLARLVTQLGRQGTRVILLLEPSECDPGGICLDEPTHERLRSVYHAFAEEFGLAVIDGDIGWPGEYYADSAHFNRAGTEAFTEFIAAELHKLGV